MGVIRTKWGSLALATLAVTAVMGADAPRADMIKDLLGLNPFAREPAKPDTLPQDDGEEDLAVCPRIDVLEGGSVIRRGGSGNDTDTLAYQLAIGDTARECRKGADDSTIVKVGVEVRALLGPAGKPGTFSTPITVQLRRGDASIVRRTRQVSVSIPAGASYGTATVVEDGLAAPEGHGDLLIEVGLGAAPAPAAKAKSSSRR